MAVMHTRSEAIIAPTPNVSTCNIVCTFNSPPTVVIADGFDDEDPGVQSKKDNDNHNYQNDYVGRCLSMTNAGRIDEIGCYAIRRFGCGHLPVVHVGIPIHVVVLFR